MRRHPLLALAGILLLLSPVIPAQAAEFEIEGVKTYLEEDAYRLDAEIDLALSDQALEALDNGVPLTIELHVRVRREGAWVWEESLYDYQERYRIRFKPLSERYSIHRLSGGEVKSFVTRDAALGDLGSIHGLRLLGQAQLDPDEDYRVHMRVSLDIDELPLPLRPIAYLRPAWKLESRWIRWPLRP